MGEVNCVGGLGRTSCGGGVFGWLLGVSGFGFGIGVGIRLFDFSLFISFFGFFWILIFGGREVVFDLGFVFVVGGCGRVGREPFAAVFPGRSKELIDGNPGIGVCCHDQFLIGPATVVKCFRWVRPS